MQVGVSLLTGAVSGVVVKVYTIDSTHLHQSVQLPIDRGYRHSVTSRHQLGVDGGGGWVVLPRGDDIVDQTLSGGHAKLGNSRGAALRNHGQSGSPSPFEPDGTPLRCEKPKVFGATCLAHRPQRLFVGDGLRVELLLPVVFILLAIFLALSPTILLSGTESPVTDVSRSDLHKGQLAAIVALEPATTPSDVAAGHLAIRDVIMTPSGNLLVAGSFVDTLSLGDDNHTSRGLRDIFVAELETSGVWLWSATGGGSGGDDVIALMVDDEGFHVLGRGYGNLTFGGHSAEMSGSYGQNSWQADLTHAGEWLAVSKIDPILLPEVSSSLWCGFR